MWQHQNRTNQELLTLKWEKMTNKFKLVDIEYKWRPPSLSEWTPKRVKTPKWFETSYFLLKYHGSYATLPYRLSFNDRHFINWNEECPPYWCALWNILIRLTTPKMTFCSTPKSCKLAWEFLVCTLIEILRNIYKKGTNYISVLNINANDITLNIEISITISFLTLIMANLIWGFRG